MNTEKQQYCEVILLLLLLLYCNDKAKFYSSLQCHMTLQKSPNLMIGYLVIVSYYWFSIINYDCYYQCWTLFVLHSKICSFMTQHNATDVASFEGACNWHADCRNVHTSCCPWIECSFLYYKSSLKVFQRIWQYIQPATQLQTTCNHNSLGPPHPASSPPRSSETSHPDSCCNNRFA